MCSEALLLVPTNRTELIIAVFFVLFSFVLKIFSNIERPVLVKVGVEESDTTMQEHLN